MIFVGIDVAKEKHDCFICNRDGEVLADVFTFGNSREGFVNLLNTINACTDVDGKIKVGLEATGHYSYNLLGFLLDNGLPTFVINPLHTNLYRKSLSLRRSSDYLLSGEKTDVDKMLVLEKIKDATPEQLQAIETMCDVIMNLK